MLLEAYGEVKCMWRANVDMQHATFSLLVTGLGNSHKAGNVVVLHLTSKVTCTHEGISN